MKEKIVLAYSGGLDTSIIIPWLQENYDYDVIACCINIGQDDDMEEVYNKAITAGASKAIILDLEEEFIKDYAFKGLKAGAIYERDYLLGTALARPLIAKALVEVAHQENATSICHGCTGKGNDQVRFETGIFAFDATLKIIAPWREWDIKSREDAIDYAEAKGIKLQVTKEKIYSRDQNLWHISHEGGMLEDLLNEHDEEELYMMVKPLKLAKDEESIVSVTFEQGVPVAVNNQKLSPANIVKTLNKIAGENGVGVIDLVENRTVGMKSRGIYESPGATVLVEALKYLEGIILDHDSLDTKAMLGMKYANLTYVGQWFSPLKDSIDAFMDELLKNVTGTINLKLYKGNIKVVSRDSEYALYDEAISSFGESELYDHHDAEGFIKLFSLPTKIRNLKEKK